MRHLVVLFALTTGCSAPLDGSKDYSSSDETATPTNYSYPSSETNDCPPPMVAVVVLDGKPTEQLIIQPCYGGSSNTTKASEPPGWGSDDNHETWIPEDIPDLKVPKPGDPIPH